MSDKAYLCRTKVSFFDHNILTFFPVYCKINTTNSGFDKKNTENVKPERRNNMKNIEELRNEFDSFLKEKNFNLSDSEVVRKAVEIETEINKIIR